MLAPERKESVIGRSRCARCSASPRSARSPAAWCIDGLVKRGARCALLRDNVVIYTGELDSLKRFKDDVREVKAGFECGMSLKNYNDLKEGDQLEVFEVVEVARTLAEARGATAQRRARIADQIQRELCRADPRCELRDPRVGMVTLTGVEVSPDQSHAKVFFTRPGRESSCDEAAAGAAARRGLPALAARAPPEDSYTMPELHFELRRIRRARRPALAAHRRGGEADAPAAKAPTAALKADRSRRPDGVLLLDKPVGLSSTRALCRRPSACWARTRPATPARSIRSPRAAAAACSARPPSSRSFLHRCATRPTRRRSAWAWTPTPATPRARSTARRAVDVDDAAHRRGRSRAFAASRRRCRRCIRRSSTTAGRSTSYARAGRGGRARARARDRRSIELEALGRDGDAAATCACAAARAPTSARSRMDIGRALGCGAHLAALRRTAVGAVSARAGRRRSRPARRGTRRRAMARLLPPEALVAGLPRVDLGRGAARRFGHGQAIGAPAGARGTSVAVFGRGGRVARGGDAPGRTGASRPLRLMSQSRAEAP